MAISARDRITRITVYDSESDMRNELNGTTYSDGVVDGSQRFEHVMFNSLPGFGEANAAMYRCEISGTSDLTGKWIRVRYAFYATDSASTRTVESLFAGKVDSCKYDRQHATRTLVAYDKIYDLRKIDISDWWLTYWSTANDSTAFEVFDALCTSFDVEHSLTATNFRNNFTILKDAQKGRKLGGCSFADFLTYVGLINGFYWYVLPGSGNLTAMAPTASFPQSFDTYTDFKETVIEDADLTAYGTFTVYDGADVIYTSGTGEPTYTFANNILLYGHTTASLVSILDVTKNYLSWFVGTRPATVEVIYSQIPERQAISVTDNGTSRTCVFNKNEMWGAQLINQRLTCTGEKVIGTQYSSALNRAANEIQKIGTELTYKVNADNVIEAVNLEAQGGVTINAAALNINGVQSANGHLKVDVNGDVEVEGKVTADEGDIGGWNITQTALQKSYTVSGVPYTAKIDSDASHYEALEIENGTMSSLTIAKTGDIRLEGFAPPTITVSKDGQVYTEYKPDGIETEYVGLSFGYDYSAKYNASGFETCVEDTSEYPHTKSILLGESGTVSPYSTYLGVQKHIKYSENDSWQYITSSLTENLLSFYNSANPQNGTTIGHSHLTIGGKDILRTHQSLVGGYGTQITSNKDLNTTEFLEVRRFFCPLDATVATLTNCPTGSAFMMDVFAPLSATIDDESASSGTRYRVRVIMTWQGQIFVQYCYWSSSGWVYGTWKVVQSSYTTQITTGGITWTVTRYADGYADMYADITLNGTWQAWGGMYVLEPTATYALPITVTKKLADVTTYRYTDGSANSALPTTYSPTSSENLTTCALLRPTAGNNNTNYYCRKYIRAKI